MIHPCLSYMIIACDVISMEMYTTLKLLSDVFHGRCSIDSLSMEILSLVIYGRSADVKL